MPTGSAEKIAQPLVVVAVREVVPVSVTVAPSTPTLAESLTLTRSVPPVEPTGIATMLVDRTVDELGSPPPVTSLVTFR